jgi:hypothetical protein
VASPGCDTCQVDLAFSGYGWTNKKVTRVTTHRVTRGMLTSSNDVEMLTGHTNELTRQATWQYGIVDVGE